MRKLRTYLILLLVSFSQTSHATDSLKLLLRSQYQPQERIPMLISLSETFRKNNMDSAWHYAGQAVEEARQAGQPTLMARAAFLKASLLQQDGQYEESIQQYVRAGSLLPVQSRADSQLLFDMHYHLIHCYNFTGRVKTALAHYDTALCYVQASDYLHRIKLNEAIAGVYSQLEDHGKAQAFYLENLQIALQHSYEQKQSLAHYDLSWTYRDLEMPDSAIYHAERALTGIIQLQDLNLLANIYALLGESYLEKDDYQKGLGYFSDAEELCQQLGYDGLICGDYAQIAHGYLQLDDLENALQYSKKALATLDDTQEYRSKRDALKTLIAVYRQNGDFEKATEALLRLTAVKDTIFDIENQRALVELEQKFKSREQQVKITKYQTELQLRQAQINTQRTLIIASGGILILLLVLIYLFWHNLKHKKKHNDRLKELDSFKTRFFANISHELRTPLSLILGPLEKLLPNIRDNNVKEELEGVQKNAKKVCKLVDEVLELSKLEASKLQLYPSAIELKELLSRIFSTYKSAAKIRQIDYRFDDQLPNGLLLYLDAGKLEKIMDNLLSNALKFTGQGGRIILRAFQKKNQIHLSVEDTGWGIAPEHLPRIFDRYYQATPKEAPLQGGTGIGLALAGELARLMGGRIEVESKVEKGSRFTFSFIPTFAAAISPPAKIKKLAPKNGNYTFRPTTPDKKTPRILIVEDNAEMSRFVSSLLAPTHRCLTAFDGQQALRILETKRIDLVISDLMMPGMDGFEFLTRLRQQPADFRDVPFVMLTARAMENDKLEALRLGVDDYLTKPFSPQELRARVQNLLHNFKSRISWRQQTENGAEIQKDDEDLLRCAEAHILRHLDNSEYRVGDLARALNYSTRQLERIICKAAGLTPVSLIREIRLQKAYQLLKSGHCDSVKKVRLEVGMDNPSYFSRAFSKRFGINPSELIN